MSKLNLKASQYSKYLQLIVVSTIPKIKKRQLDVCEEKVYVKTLRALENN